MTLNQEQQARLVSMTRDYLPAIEISRWLTRECGLTFKEAVEARIAVLKELGIGVFEHSERSQANLNVYHMKLEAEKKATTNAKRAATRAANKQRELNAPEVEQFPVEQLKEPEKDRCITCGDETFGCACEVKRTADIPF